MAEEEVQVFKDRSFTGLTVELSKKTRMNGAQRCEYVDCELVLDSKGLPAIGREGERFWFARCSFERCTFVVKGKLRRLDLSDEIRMRDCAVSGGPLIEPWFGVRPSNADSVPEQERPITNCNFTKAELRDACFYRTAWGEVQMPGWPFVSVLSQDGDAVFAPASPRLPARSVLVDEVTDHDWGSVDMRISMMSLVFGVGLRPYERQIQVCHAETLAERGRASVDDVRAALDRFAHPAIRY